jgi:hypothetical protein
MRDAHAPPAFVERAIAALVADDALREAVLGDLAESFAVLRARDGAGAAWRWYLAQAVRSAPSLLALSWWPARGRRARRIGALGAGVAGAFAGIQLLHQAAQLGAATVIARAGLPPYGGAFVASSLIAGAACGVLGGYAMGRVLRRAALAGATALALACGALAVTGMLINRGVMPLWYWGGLQLLLLPLSVCVGGLLHLRHDPRARDNVGDATAIRS